MVRRNTLCKLYPVNRLDRGTSGAVILAKSSSSAGIYGRQVKETGLDKLYLALAWGTPDTSGIITEPLDGKESETRYTILLAGDNCSLLAVTPISGRMHQIRRHLLAAGHPVVGDKRYGGGDMPELPGFALHSFRTVLVLADTEQLTVCAPLPDELLQLCEQRGIGSDGLLETVYRLAGA
jgi:23S rRNA pseudouridine955/2504/2580 synthase